MTSFTVVDIETSGRSPWAGRLLNAGVGSKSWRGALANRRLRAAYEAPGVVVEQGLFDARWALLAGATLRADIHDLMTMAWLLDEEQPLDLASLMDRYLGEQITKPIVQRANVAVWSTAVWPIPGDDRAYVPLDEVPAKIMTEYNGADLDEEGRLYRYLIAELKREGLLELFLRDEVPLAGLLARIEATGLPFDLEACEELRVRVAAEAAELEADIIADVGIPLKLSSPIQVGDYMFKTGEVRIKGRVPVDDVPANFVVEKSARIWAHGYYAVQGRGLKWPAAKKASGHRAVKRTNAGLSLEAKREWSTSSTDLVMENADDEFVQDLVLWRELDKLGGYLDKYPTFVHDGRMYGSINRTGTVTGRFSSRQPNLQQVPAHGRFGAEVRGLFRGALVVADYSQLENRVMAHFSQDAGLLKAYADHIDLYGLAASILFGGEPSKDHPQRGLMKTTILSLQYGAGFAKLGMLLTRGGYPTDMYGAKTLVVRLREEAFPDMFAWRDEAADRAIIDGVVETLGGRRRRFTFDPGWIQRRHRIFPDLSYYADSEEARKMRQRQYRLRERPTDRDYQQLTMERQAISAIISGSGADIVAGGMVDSDRRREGDEYRMLIQVHDEVLWEQGDDWAGAASLAKIREAGETGHGFVLDGVALEFEPMIVASWAEKGMTQTGEGHVVKDRLAKARSEGMQARKASDFVADRRAMRDADERGAGSGDEKGVARARIAAKRRARRRTK